MEFSWVKLVNTRNIFQFMNPFPLVVTITTGSLEFNLLTNTQDDDEEAYLHSVFIVLCVDLSAIQSQVHVFVMLVSFCGSSLV